MKVADLMGLLFEVGKAFGTLAADAERIAHGGRAEVDVDGRLSTLAERARAAAGEVKAEVNPLVEFGRALATLDELGGKDAPAVNGEAWGLFQDEFNKSRKGDWKLLATPREVAAWRLSADCRGLAKCASVLAFAHGLVDTTREWCRGRVTEAEEKVATAEAEMHRARAGELEALAERYAEGSAERTAMEKQAAEERRAAASDKARAAALASQAEPWKGAGELLVERIREMEERNEEERKGHYNTAAELARALRTAEEENAKRLDGSHYEEEKQRNLALARERLHRRLTDGAKKIAPSSWQGEQAARAVLDEMRAEGRVLPYIQERRLLDLYGKWKREKGQA